uniref:Chromo domain-containing protein n=1 Tax=Acrobeloides nanus TaxID=290746 RepID=A0A914CBT0_9BILA
MKKRVGKGGQVEYFIKWQGYPHSENTWEPAQNCACEDLIVEFEKNWRADQEKKKEDIQKKVSELVAEEKTKTYRILEGKDPVERINGVRVLGENKENSSGTLEYEALVKYKSGFQEMVPTSILANKAPMPLIQFYESRLRFGSAC